MPSLQMILIADGICDILIGGNQSRAKPETGIYNAGYGLLLKGKTDATWYSHYLLLLQAFLQKVRYVI